MFIIMLLLDVIDPILVLEFATKSDYERLRAIMSDYERLSGNKPKNKFFAQGAQHFSGPHF